jgi:hypothetical protein
MLEALPQAQEERRSQRLARLQPHPGIYREVSTEEEEDSDQDVIIVGPSQPTNDKKNKRFHATR